MRIRSVDAEKFCERWRQVYGARHGCSIDASIEVGSPKDTRHAMSGVEAIGMMQLAVLVDLVITAKLRPNHDGGVRAKIGMRFHPVDEFANRRIRLHYCL